MNHYPWELKNTNNPLLCSFSLQIIFFFRSAVLQKLFDIRFSYKHCNFSRVCLLVKMASKTVTRSIILIDRWQVLSYLSTMSTWYACRCWTKLITQFDRNRGLQDSIVLIVLPSILEVNASKEEKLKKSLSVFVLDSKTKEDDKIVLPSVGFEISRER